MYPYSVFRYVNFFDPHNSFLAVSLYPVVGPPLFGHCRSRSNCLVCVLHAIAYKPISLCMHSVRNQLTLSLMTKRHLNAHFRRRSVDVVAFDSRSQKVDQSNSTLLNDVFTRSDRQKRAVCGGSKCPCRSAKIILKGSLVIEVSIV